MPVRQRHSASGRCPRDPRRTRPGRRRRMAGHARERPLCRRDQRPRPPTRDSRGRPQPRRPGARCPGMRRSATWLASLAEGDALRYAGFNLLAGDGQNLWHLHRGLDASPSLTSHRDSMGCPTPRWIPPGPNSSVRARVSPPVCMADGPRMPWRPSPTRVRRATTNCPIPVWGSSWNDGYRRPSSSARTMAQGPPPGSNGMQMAVSRSASGASAPWA